MIFIQERGTKLLHAPCDGTDVLWRRFAAAGAHQALREVIRAQMHESDIRQLTGRGGSSRSNLSHRKPHRDTDHGRTTHERQPVKIQVQRNCGRAPGPIANQHLIILGMLVKTQVFRQRQQLGCAAASLLTAADTLHKSLRTTRHR